jgi:hypothetical protein
MLIVEPEPRTVNFEPEPEPRTMNLEPEPGTLHLEP